MRAFVALISNPDSKSALLEDVDKSIRLDGERWDSYFLKAMILDYFDDKGKAKCECIKNAISRKAPMTKELEDYYCKGRKLKNKSTSFSFAILPTLKKEFKNK